jgi:hypothetical protein
MKKKIKTAQPIHIKIYIINSGWKDIMFWKDIKLQ